MKFPSVEPLAGPTMNIFLTSAYDSHACLDALRANAALAISGRHVLGDSPEEADAILFVENTHFDDLRWTRLLRDPLLRRFREKSFVYNESDKPWDVLAGLYCSLTAPLFEPTRHVAFPYLGAYNEQVRDVHASDVERRWLFSFVGAMSHSCRRSILALQHSDALVRDTSGFDVWHAPAEERDVRARQFADVLAASRFVLCPRGIGTSSLRLFETMQAGRAPVIIADEWLPPPHVDWSFALRVSERDIASVPALLVARADEAEERGRVARAAWEASYAPEMLFDTVCDSIEYLLTGERGKRRHPYRSGIRKWLLSGEAVTRQTMRLLRRVA